MRKAAKSNAIVGASSILPAIIIRVGHHSGRPCRGIRVAQGVFEVKLQRPLGIVFEENEGGGRSEGVRVVEVRAAIERWRGA